MIIISVNVKMIMIGFCCAVPACRLEPAKRRPAVLGAIEVYAMTARSEGRRELNKREKLDKITRAAREVFSTKGFENATMREIAAEAGIGYGTIFLYAPSKEALLVLVFRSELGRIVDEAFASMPAKDVRAQVRSMFDVVIRSHAESPVLFQPFLREVLAVGAPEMQEIREFIAHWRARVAGLLEAAARRREIASGHNPAIVAELLLDALAMSLRRFVTGGLSRTDLDRHLDCAIELLCPRVREEHGRTRAKGGVQTNKQ